MVRPLVSSNSRIASDLDLMIYDVVIDTFVFVVVLVVDRGIRIPVVAASCHKKLSISCKHLSVIPRDSTQAMLKEVFD